MNTGDFSSGDLFLSHDHACISAHSPGIGSNLDEYGARFYDCSNSYDKELTAKIGEALASNSVRFNAGEIFWVNNSSIPTAIYAQMAEGLSTDRCTFKGLVKSGVSELLAVQHRQSKDHSVKYRSAMLGIITDSVVRRQA